jgi:hypothetical protein
MKMQNYYNKYANMQILQNLYFEMIEKWKEVEKLIVHKYYN